MFKIDNRAVGKGMSCFIIAELSANHNHDIDIAKKTILAAKEAGADAIKLQTYTPDTLTIDCDNEYFKIQSESLWDGRTLYDLYQEAYTPWEWHKELMDLAKDVGLICFSSPFDTSAVDLLEKLDVPAYKIASFEITDIPLIEYTASKGKPIILSTGIANLENILDAVNACRKVGNDQIAILKCTSAYPAPIDEANLIMIKDFQNEFDVVSGLSDHTLGTLIPSLAITFGASIIEKHFILDKSIGGPDSEFSLDVKEFKEMVRAVRMAEAAIGHVDYEISEKVEKNRVFARSLFVVEDINKGDVFTEKNIRSIRPGYGISPKYLPRILGKHSTMNLKRGTPLQNNHFE